MNVDEATIVNVPLVVNVCIVYHPLVVIVPPVEVGDTQSLQSVLYAIITTQFQPLPPVALLLPPPPQPNQLVQLFGVPDETAVPPHPVPTHCTQGLSHAPHHPPPYSIEVQDIELNVPTQPLPPHTALLALEPFHQVPPHPPHP